MSISCYYHAQSPGTPYAPNICNDTSTDTGFYPCCAIGDYCLPNNLCHFTHYQNGTSGYYAASCTDPNHQDPACSQECNDLTDPDVVYNRTSSLWACCGLTSDGLNNVNCADPTIETFEAPAPEVLLQSTVALLTYTPSPTSSTSSATSTTTSTSASATSSAAASKSKGMSGGTDAAIALGVVLGVLILALLVAGAYLFRRRSKNGNTASHHEPRAAEAMGEPSYTTNKYHHQPQSQPQLHQHNSGYSGQGAPPYDTLTPPPKPAVSGPHEVSSLHESRPQELGI